MTITSPFSYFQPYLPRLPAPRTTLPLYPLNTSAPGLQGGGFGICSPISWLGCLVNNPFLGCKPQHLAAHRAKEPGSVTIVHIVKASWGPTKTHTSELVTWWLRIRKKTLSEADNGVYLTAQILAQLLSLLPLKARCCLICVLSCRKEIKPSDQNTWIF